MASPGEPGTGGVVARVGRVGILVVENFKRHSLVPMAGALAFIVLLAFFPTLSVLSAFFEGPFKSRLGGSMSPDQINQLFQQLSMGPFFWSSFAILVLMGLWILVTLERSFHQMWSVRRPRPLVFRFAIYLMMYALGVAALFLSFASAWFLLSPEQIKQTFGPGVLWAVAMRAGPVVVSSFAFSLLYIYMSGTYVPRGAAITGGIVAGALFEGLKFVWIFVGTLLGSQAFTAAVIMYALTFAILLFLDWLVILFGATVAYSIQHSKTHRRELDLPAASQTLKERLAVRATLQVCRAFMANRPAPGTDDLSAGLNTPLRLVDQVVYQLSLGGILREASDKGRKGWSPARDPQQITVKDVLEAIRAYGWSGARMPEDPQGEGIENLLVSSWDKVSKSLGRVNFRDLSITEDLESAESPLPKRAV